MNKIVKLTRNLLLVGMLVVPFTTLKADEKKQLKDVVSQQDNCDLVILKCANGNVAYVLLCGTKEQKDKDFSFIRDFHCGG